MKKIILLASLTLIFTSCSRSSDNTNEIIVDPVVEAPNLPTKISGSWGVKTIKYNGNKLSEIISSNSKTVFEYSGSLITKTISYDNSGVQTGTVDFVYSNGKLTNVSSNATNNKKTFVYSYPDANTVVKTKVRNYTAAGEPMTDKEDVTYTLKNGNIVSEEMVYYHNNKLYGNISATYTYDDKNNVYKNILGFDKIKVYLFADLKDYVGSGSNNNLLNIKMFIVIVIHPVIILHRLFLSNMAPITNNRGILLQIFLNTLNNNIGHYIGTLSQNSQFVLML